MNIPKIRFVDFWVGDVLYASVDVSPRDGKENISIRIAYIVSITKTELIDDVLGSFSLTLLSEESIKELIKRFEINIERRENNASI